MQNCILRNRSNGAAIQADSVHGGQAKVTHKATHKHNPWRWGTKPFNTKVTHKVTHKHNPWRWGTKPLNTNVTHKVTHNHNPWRWGTKPSNTKVTHGGTQTALNSWITTIPNREA
jgi:hypothetical protein